jgi:hypothetical protein
MKITAEPRSDQWNADDFTAGPRIFTIAGVKDGAAEQKYDIQLQGEERVWRPPLTMIRVLMQAWGDQSDIWVGRRVQLFQDQTVTFGRDAVGGVRISALSHIDGPMKMKLTTTRGKRATYSVQPLKDEPKQATPAVPADVVAAADKAAAEGTIDGYLAWLAEQGAPEHITAYVTGRKTA